MNPFRSEENNNNIRPRNAGVNEKDATTATIVLVSPNTSTTKAVDKSVNFFSQLKQFVPAPGMDSQATALPSSGSIPRLTAVGSNYYGIFKNFSIVSFAESKSEIAKINLNFSSTWNAYFFGSNPKVYSYSGIFLDTKDYPYYEEFSRAYDNYLAGGKCASLGYIMYMSYDTKIIVGYMLGIDTHAQGDDPNMKSFSFRLLVRDENFYRTHIIRTESGNLVDGESINLNNVYLTNT